MRRILTVSICGLALMLVTGACATSNARTPVAGDWEVMLAASGANDEDFDVGTAGAGLGLGTYLGEVTEVGVRQNVNFSDFGDSNWNGSTRIFADFHLVGGNLRPFVGANFGWVYGDTVDETLAAAPEAGLKWHVTESGLFFLTAEYQFFFEESDEIDEGFDNGQFVYSLGIGLLF